MPSHYCTVCLTEYVDELAYIKNDILSLDTVKLTLTEVVALLLQRSLRARNSTEIYLN